MQQMGRGVTAWNGVGAYTGEDTEIMTVVVNKYEVSEIKQIIKMQDPDAFVLFLKVHMSAEISRKGCERGAGR